MRRENIMIHHIVSQQDKYSMIERDRGNTNISFLLIEELAGEKHMDSSLDEIVIDQALSFCPNKEYYLGVIDFAVLKLRKNGSLIIKDLDALSLCDSAHENLDKFNESIVGKTLLHTWQSTRTRLREHNINVESVSINESNYTIKCSKK